MRRLTAASTTSPTPKFYAQAILSLSMNPTDSSPWVRSLPGSPWGTRRALPFLQEPRGWECRGNIGEQLVPLRLKFLAQYILEMHEEGLDSSMLQSFVSPKSLLMDDAAVLASPAFPLALNFPLLFSAFPSLPSSDTFPQPFSWSSCAASRAPRCSYGYSWRRHIDSSRETPGPVHISRDPRISHGASYEP